MAQKCRVCSHKQTKDIEKDIVQGMAHTTIGKKYGIHFQSVRYHSENHLPEKLVRAVQKKKSNHADNILDGIKDLLDRTKDILDKAEEDGHNRLALDAIKEARGTYELLSKIAVKLEEYRQRNKEQEKDYAEEHVQKGLKALTTAELKTYIQLQGKIAMADPDHELDQQARYIVHAMNTVQPDNRNNNNIEKPSKPPRTRPAQDKNSQITGAPDEPEPDFEELELEDLDDLDLELEDLPSNNRIPSELDDPKWLRDYRRKSGRLF